MRVLLDIDVYQAEQLIKCIDSRIREKQLDEEQTLPRFRDPTGLERKIQYLQRLGAEIEAAIYKDEPEQREIAELERDGETERAARVRKDLAVKRIGEFFDLLDKQHDRLFAGLIK